MGNMYICLKAMLGMLGVETVVPPPTSKKTILLGVRHCPEFACLPMKVNLGNFLEAHEKGADTILMAGGVGPCRFGYYAQVQREIIEDLGLDFKLIVLEPPQKHITELLVKIKELTGNKSWGKIIRAVRFGFLKAVAVDKVEQRTHYIRPRETVTGSVEKAYQRSIQLIDAAKTPKELVDVEREINSLLNQVSIDPHRQVLKVGLVGEIYVLLEPFVNLEIERTLGRMGVEVERSIYLSEWINDHLFMGLLRMKGSKHAKEKSSPYVNHGVGGHGRETIGSTVLYSERDFDGVVQLAPFTCMPEIIAESILPHVSRERKIPTFSLVVDEHSGEAGVVTRLEAFVDLLKRKRNIKEGITRCLDILG